MKVSVTDPNSRMEKEKEKEKNFRISYNEKFSSSEITHACSQSRGERLTNEDHFISMKIRYEGFEFLYFH